MGDTVFGDPSRQTTLPLKAIDLGDGTYAQAIMSMTTAVGLKYKNITGAGTTLIKTGSGSLVSLVFNKYVSLGTCTIYDNTVGSGTTIGTISLPLTLLSTNGAVPYGVGFTTGLTLVVTGAMDMTVVYN